MIKRLLYILFLFLSSKQFFAQCPQFYDYLGNLSNQPYFVNCTGSASYNMNLISNTSWGAYTIDWGDGTANTVGGSYTANALINHIYNSASPDTFAITVIIPSASCTLTGVAVMEKPVNASIQIPIGGVTTACAPKALQFTNSSTDVSETTWFTWNFGDGSPVQTFSYTNAGQTISHTYNAGTVNCQTMVTLTAKNYCTAVPTIANFNPIQIYDKDDAAITPSAFIKCWPDNTFTFTNSTNRNCVPQGNTFQRQEKWNFGNYWGMGHDSIVGWQPWPPTSPATIAYPAVGTYSVMLSDSNLCGVDVQIINVSIVNPPTAGVLAPSAPLCQGAGITFTNTSAAGYSYRWNFGDGGGFVSKPFGPQTYTYSAPGSYTVSVVALIPGSGAACTDTDKVVVNILPKPIASFSLTPGIGCNTLSNVSFTDLSVNATAWDWNFGNGNTFSGQTPPLQNYNSVGSYVGSLTVTAANTCVNSFTLPIRVYQTPAASFPVTTACAQSVTSFTDNSTFMAGDPIISWNWNFGDASPTATSSVQNPTHTYSAQSTYTVQLIVSTANCSDTTTQTITINTKPAADFSLTPISGCPTLTVSFTNLSMNADTYLWDFANGSTSTSTHTIQSFLNTSSTNSVYTVSLTAQTNLGCTDLSVKSLTVYPNPTASITANSPAGCSPVATTFTNSSLGATSYTWNFGDGNSSTSTSTTVAHVFTNSTLLIQTFTTQLIAQSVNGCLDSTTTLITVYPRPIFNFTMVPNSGCSPLSVNFPPVLGAVSYQWDFGDGSPTSSSPNPTHTFTNNTTSDLTYTVQLIASNAFGCADTAYGNPVVFAKPLPVFAHTPTVGCSPMAVTFSNTSVAAVSAFWYYGDGNTSSTLAPTHTYTNSGGSTQTFTCTMVAISAHACRDSVSHQIVLLPQPVAAFNVDTPACAPKVLTFTNTSSGANSYSWDFGTSTSVSTNVSIAYTNTTTSNVTSTVQLIATSVNNCKDTSVVSLIIHPKPSFTIAAMPDSGCTALDVNLLAAGGVMNYQWNFGDGNASMAANPNNVYYNNQLNSTKTFTVQLFGSDAYGCKDTATKVITVFSKPNAYFTVNPSNVFIPNNPVNFTNQSSADANSFFWQFGDNQTSTLSDPVYYYQTVGMYQPILIVSNNHGCKDTFMLQTLINANLDSEIDVPNAFSPNPNGGNGGIFSNSDNNNDVFHPVIRGVDKYELNIFSRWGELLFVSKDLNVGWDGYYKGKLCTQDVYIWKIKATTVDNKKIDKTGDLLLLR